MPINLLENLIAGLSPERALRRDTARAHRKILAAHEAALSARMSAAKRDRTTADWPSQSVGPHSAIALDAPVTNARARHAKDNTWQGAAIASNLRRNVNNTGITPRSRANAPRPTNTKAEKQRLREFRRRLDRSWRWRMRDAALCDVEGRETLNDKINLVVEERKFVGTGFLVWSIGRHVPGAATAPLQLQAFELEQLDTSKDTVRSTRDGHVIRNGIETDAQGRIIFYHVHLKNHPQEDLLLPGDSVPIPAHRVLMLGKRTRFGQSLAPSEISPVLLKLWRNNQYDEHEQIAKQIEAFFAMVIQMDPRYGPPNLGTPTKPTDGTMPGTVGGGNTESPASPTYRELNLGPGMIPELMVGEELKTINPTRPGPQYEAYMKAQHGMIATGSDMSYSGMMRRFDGTYVNGRMTVNEDEKVYDLWQMQVVDYLLRPLRNLYTNLCVLLNIDGLGDLASDYFDSAAHTLAYQECEWMPPRRKPIDPAKQAAADAINLEYFLTHRGEILNERNILVEDLLIDIHLQRELADEFEITFPEFAAAIAAMAETEGQGHDPTGDGTKAQQSKPKVHGTGEGGAGAATSARRGLTHGLITSVMADALKDEPPAPTPSP